MTAISGPPRPARYELEIRQLLGARIRALRLQKGLNQDDFAALVGIHRAHPGKLENAKIEPGSVHLCGSPPPLTQAEIHK